jgi:hypothetical protein
VTMDEALRKYNEDPRFYRLVTYLKQDVRDGVWTPEEAFLVEEKRKQTRYPEET